MASISTLLQSYVDMPYDELLGLAKSSFSRFVGPLLERTGAVGASKICAMITAACLGADGELSPLEHKFFNDLLNTNDSYTDNSNFVQEVGNDESRRLVNELVNTLPTEQKAAVASFCLCFLAVDETITRSEIAFIEQLI